MRRVSEVFGFQGLHAGVLHYETGQQTQALAVFACKVPIALPVPPSPGPRGAGLLCGSRLFSPSHTKILQSRAEVTGERCWPDREMVRRALSSACHLCIYTGKRCILWFTCKGLGFFHVSEGVFCSVPLLTRNFPYY